MSRIRDTALFSDSALKGYWELDGNLNDSSPSGYNLGSTNAPTSVAGRYNNGYQFVAASNQNAYTSIVSAPNIDTTGSQTWTCWVKFNSFISYMSLMAVSNNTGTIDRYILGSNDGVEHTIYWNLTGLGTPQIGTTGFTFSTGVWYHIACVYDASVPELRIYVNGVSNNSSGTSGTPSAIGTGNPNNAIALGSRGDSATVYPLDAILDDVAIFNRVLTPTEISNLYNGTSASASLSPSSSASSSVSRSLSPSASLSPSSSISASVSASTSASLSPSASFSPSASSSPSPTDAILSVDLFEICFSTGYSDQYSTQNTVFTDQYSAQNTSFTDKYVVQNTIFVDQYGQPC